MITRENKRFSANSIYLTDKETWLEDLLPELTITKCRGREYLTKDITLNSNAKDGDSVHNVRWTSRIIELEYLLEDSNEDTFRNILRRFNSALSSKTQIKIQFNDDFDYYIKGILNLEEPEEYFGKAMTGIITITCPNPFIYAMDEEVEEVVNGEITINVDETFNCKPILRSLCTEDTKSITWTNTNTGATLQFGNVTDDEEALDDIVIVKKDNMANFDGLGESSPYETGFTRGGTPVANVSWSDPNYSGGIGRTLIMSTANYPSLGKSEWGGPCLRRVINSPIPGAGIRLDLGNCIFYHTNSSARGGIIICLYGNYQGQANKLCIRLRIVASPLGTTYLCYDDYLLGTSGYVERLGKLITWNATEFCGVLGRSTLEKNSNNNIWVETLGSKCSFDIGGFQKTFVNKEYADVEWTNVVVQRVKRGDSPAVYASIGGFTLKQIFSISRKSNNPIPADNSLIADCTNYSTNMTPLNESWTYTSDDTSYREYQLGALTNDWENFYLSTGENTIKVDSVPSQEGGEPPTHYISYRRVVI